MESRESRYRAHRFVALRINTLGCLLLLTPVILWSPVLGMSALVVALVWTITFGARSANAWASARAQGLPGQAAATSADWRRAAAVLVLGLAATVLAAAALEQLTVLGEWLGAPGIGRPVVAALAIALVGAVPGVAVVVVSSRSRTLTAAAPGPDGPPERQRAEEGWTGGRRAAAVVAAAVLGVVNVVVLTSITPLGDWVGDGAGERIIAVAVLALAFATPAAAVWYANRTGDSEPGR